MQDVPMVLLVVLLAADSRQALEPLQLSALCAHASICFSHSSIATSSSAPRDGMTVRPVSIGFSQLSILQDNDVAIKAAIAMWQELVKSLTKSLGLMPGAPRSQSVEFQHLAAGRVHPSPVDWH